MIIPNVNTITVPTSRQMPVVTYEHYLEHGATHGLLLPNERVRFLLQTDMDGGSAKEFMHAVQACFSTHDYKQQRGFAIITQRGDGMIAPSWAASVTGDFEQWLTIMEQNIQERDLRRFYVHAIYTCGLYVLEQLETLTHQGRLPKNTVYIAQHVMNVIKHTLANKGIITNVDNAEELSRSSFYSYLTFDEGLIRMKHF